ncbi:MAG: TldD/PmbA family protein [Nocardioides sp.]
MRPSTPSNVVAHHDIDPDFLSLPYRELASTVLERLASHGVTHGEFRFERTRSQHVAVRDEGVLGAHDAEDLGFAVRVVHHGAWGFAAGVLLTEHEAIRVADQAVAVSVIAASMTSVPVELAEEPVYRDVSWVSDYLLDPTDVSIPDKVELLTGWSSTLRKHQVVAHATASLQQVQEIKFYADLAGSLITQQRVRLQPSFEAMGANETTGTFDSMRTIAPPVGRGWEYLDGGYDWATELAQVPELLAEKLQAPTVEAGIYDLVIDPSNLWLTIHESIGHATELDRALGYEANYAGTSFATIDQLGSLRYGSEVMHVTGDRTIPHGLATVGYDDEGVAGQSWDIVRDGVLVGFQLDRAMAKSHPELNTGRSNGCAYADSPSHLPIQRMANVSLQPGPDGPATDELIADVDRGIYVVGDKSWSIDMQRFNFQFTGQRFYAIRHGRLVGQLRDVAYQATTTDFWRSMTAVGGPQTWVLGGAFNCGKAQPGQVASVSHGCPAALFRQVRILNTLAEGGQ